MATKKALTLSLATLAKSVDAAVKLAATRHKLAVEKDTLLNRWEIFGRRLRNVADFNAAYSFAEEVTKNVNVAGIQVDPVVAKFGKHILVGFVERDLVPRLISG